MEKYKVVKVLNNNVILVDYNCTKYILVGKGIGFGKKTDQLINDLTGIESKFISLEGLDSNSFSTFTDNLDPKILEITKDILKMISDEFNKPLDPKVHVGLIDHIQFTVKRLKDGLVLENPFLNETKLLYPKEYGVAEKAVTILSKELNMNFPDAEIGFITLHICGGLHQGSKKDALENAQLITKIINYVSEKLNIKLDPSSFEYSGFVNHIKGVLNRIKNNKTIKNNLLTELKRKNIIEYKIAYDVSKIIENVLQISVPEDEVGYITIHIMKLNSIVNC
ncbi:PRD domain-containing protein [Clostridium botulinum C]|uniref:PRD domain-containing protein n=3 Tax=Clostridium botulinum TaxID=1491 RepID=A0A9Q4XTB5_CLOBO|nr:MULTISPECIES: PRD domain-containing protein [Clostridium]AYF54305.1 PRD domain-containing protein [Clostridium novyi]EES92118.1 sacpa operon antiterminator [Clostridium botulinum D str. 1873]KEI08658.1 antiterminator [Clostridium sp. K25]MBO3442235.1 PRD domain-containing protein [Clostridium haemolyticum]MCD3195627.1 PRD domain-containing protein [Clostridium botulinum C]